MYAHDVEHVLRNLDELDIDNLVAGRFTKDAINEAFKRLKTQSNFDVKYLGVGAIASVSDRVLADELNDMLEAAKYRSHKTKDGTCNHKFILDGGPCIRCHRTVSDIVNERGKNE